MRSKIDGRGRGRKRQDKRLINQRVERKKKNHGAEEMRGKECDKGDRKIEDREGQQQQQKREMYVREKDNKN